MAKLKTPKVTKPKVSKELDLFKDIIPAADAGIKELWDAASDTGKKEIKNAFWILNRIMSSVRTNDPEIEMHCLIAVNEYYNKNWFNIQRHPKLVWLTLCTAAHQNKQPLNHELISLKTYQSKKVKVLLNLFPNMKTDDVYTLAEITTEDEIEEHCRNLGWEEKQINELKLQV